MSGSNGSHGMAPAQPWVAESPFATESLYQSAPSAITTSPAVAFGPAQELESPFVTEYAYGAPADSLRAEQYASIVGELQDGEFDEAVTDLVNEAATFLEQQFTMEGEDAAQERAVAERALREYFAPLQREAETVMERLAAEAGAANLPALTEPELEAILDRARAAGAPLPPAMEQFLGKLVKKAKQAVKSAVRLAKKGVALANRISPVHIVLNKLKALVRPLLERVLKFALDKLPVSVRPIATQLAARMFGGRASESFEEETAHAEEELDEAQEPATADPREIQEEVDAELAGTLVAGEEFERQLSVEEVTVPRDPMRDLAGRRLAAARRRFADRVLTLREGENPQPALEEFIPALLAAAKVGISILGRPRVVKQLAELIVPLISKYIGRQPALALSTKLVDTGLRLMSLELTEEDELRTAAHTVASTVEGAVNRLLTEAPASAWESETVLKGYVRSAVESEAAAAFPDSAIRAELHETAQMSGQWVEMPLRSAKKLYRKYSRVSQVSISPQQAAQIRTFGGVTLAAFLRDKLGLASHKAVSARVHLYEIKRGATLSLLAMYEKDVPGLGSARREAWSQLHPLTRSAAGLLFGEPKLGADVDSRFLADRNLVMPGQRFFHLEIEGAVVRVPPGTAPVGVVATRPADQRPAHSSQALFVVDTPRREIRVSLYYSEADAQLLASGLRQRAEAAPVLATVRLLAAGQLQVALARPGRNARLIHDRIQAARAPRHALRRAVSQLGTPLTGMLLEWIVDAVRRELEERYDTFSQRFVAAADAAADGVTMTLTFAAPPVLERLKALLGRGLSLAAAPTSLRRFKGGQPSFDVRPGFASAA